VRKCVLHQAGAKIKAISADTFNNSKDTFSSVDDYTTKKTEFRDAEETKTAFVLTFYLMDVESQ
jgi:hypothetical protein